MSTARQQEREKKDPTLHAQASKRKARGSHCQRGKGHQRRSKLTLLPTRMLPGSILDLKFTMSQCPKTGLRCRFAAVALTPPSSMS